MDIIGNNSSNSVLVRDNRNSLNIQNVNIEQMTVINQGTQTGNNLNPLINENNLLTGPSNNNINFENINRTSTSSSTSSEVRLNNRFLFRKSEDFNDLFTRKIDINNNIPKIIVSENNNSQDNLLDSISNNEEDELLIENNSRKGKSGIKRTIIKIIKRSRSENNFFNTIKYFLSNKSDSNLNNKDKFPLIANKIIRISNKDYNILSDYMTMIIVKFNNSSIISSNDKINILNFYNDLHKNIEDFKNIKTVY
jgi:hypothetical protein